MMMVINKSDLPVRFQKLQQVIEVN